MMKTIVFSFLLLTVLSVVALENKEAQSLAYKAYHGDDHSFGRLKKAADDGDAVAQNWLGSYYREKHDVNTALFWFNKSAAQNNSLALNNLGFVFSEGIGVQANSNKAIQYYKRAAMLGNIDAHHNLALMYAQGEGVPQSYEQAYSWFEKAADKGDPLATANIGLYYAQGLGVQKNETIAFALCKRAVLLGVNQAQRCKAELIKHMNQGQINVADQLAQQIEKQGVRNAIAEYLSQRH